MRINFLLNLCVCRFGVVVFFSFAFFVLEFHFFIIIFAYGHNKQTRSLLLLDLYH